MNDLEQKIRESTISRTIRGWVVDWEEVQNGKESVEFSFSYVEL